MCLGQRITVCCLQDWCPFFFEIGSLMGLELTNYARLTGQCPQGPFCLFLLTLEF